MTEINLDVTSTIPHVEEALEYAKLSKLVHKITSLNNDDPSNFTTNKALLQKTNPSPNLQLHHFQSSEFTTVTITGPQQHTVKALIASSTLPIASQQPSSPTSNPMNRSQVKYICVAFGGPESAQFWNQQKSSLLCPMGPSDKGGNDGLPFPIELSYENIESSGILMEESPVKAVVSTNSEDEKVKLAKEKIKGMSLLETIEAQRSADMTEDEKDEAKDDDTGIVAVTSMLKEEVKEEKGGEEEETDAIAIVDTTENTSVLVEDTNNIQPTNENESTSPDDEINDEERIRGSPTPNDITNDEERIRGSPPPINPSPTPPPEPPSEPTPPPTLDIHAAINSALFDTNLYIELEAKLNQVLATHPGHAIILTGFGIGGAMATVFASYLSQQKPISQLRAVSYGSPRIASDIFGKWLESISNLLIWRFVLRHDYIVGVPSVAMGFRHFGHMMHLEDGKEQKTKAYYYSGVKGIGEGVDKDGYWKPPELLTPMMELVDPIDHHDMNSYIQFLQKKSVTNPNTYYATQFVRTEESSYNDSTFLERWLSMLDKTCGSA